MLLCIDRLKNNSNQIILYRIQDIYTGEVRDFEPLELKRYIKNGVFQVINLRLTSDGRLIIQRVENYENPNQSHYTVYDGASISIVNKPVYSESESKRISNIMSGKEKKKSSFLYRLFGKLKDSNDLNYINTTTASDEYNSDSLGSEYNE